MLKSLQFARPMVRSGVRTPYSRAAIIVERFWSTENSAIEVTAAVAAPINYATIKAGT